jgi:hypothetical protein
MGGLKVIPDIALCDFLPESAFGENGSLAFTFA